MAETPLLNLVYLSTGQAGKEIVVNDNMLILDTVIGGGGGILTYKANFTNQTTVTIPGATHGFGTADLGVIVWDNSTPRQLLPTVAVTVDTGTFAVVLTFNEQQSGRVLLFKL